MIATAEKLHWNTIDETGNRYGRLMVLGYVGSRGTAKATRARWRCRCQCGTEVTVNGLDLRSGNSKSCGCWRNELRYRPDGVAAFNQLYLNLSGNAQVRKYKFDLTPEQVRNLVVQNCYYCDAPPASVFSRPGGDFYYNGLDRVNNNIGYSLTNVRTCCKHCNYAKGTKTVAEFKAWLTRAYKHFVEGNAQ